MDGFEIFIAVFVIASFVIGYLLQYSYVDIKNTSEPTLKKRGKGCSAYIVIKECTDKHIGYESPKLHFGSATVGGVTSGGFYTTGGGNKTLAESKTGRYSLCVVEENKKYYQIKRIRLTDELYHEAQNSRIAKYLDSETQSIQIPQSNYVSSIDMNNAINWASGKPVNGVFVLPSSGISYDVCKEIHDWICGKD